MDSGLRQGNDDDTVLAGEEKSLIIFTNSNQSNQLNL